MTFQQYPQKLGIPSGNTAGRPSNPVVGDTYYNGELEILEIFNGTIWVATSAPPATPSIATPVDVGTVAFASGGSLTVVFTPGSGGGTPNQYNAFTTAGGFSAFSSNTTVTLSGLTPATSFVVYGNAQNNFGTTVNTPNAAAVTTTTRPQTPTIGTASTSSVTSDITVTWTLGATGGKNLSAITITPYLNGTTAQTSQTAATTSSTTHTFTGLQSGSAYTFKVKATNANGDSPESSATNSVTVPIIVDYLVVAGGASGGGAGAGHSGGGGGAGGYRTGSLSVLLSTNYTTTVGAGGATKTSNGLGNAGSDSVFSTITSAGGGGGGIGNINGANGGSGGGGGAEGTGSLPGNASPAGQGNNGGLGFDGVAVFTVSGGGGGAGQVGGAATPRNNDANGGAGGNGLANSITGTSVTYAGGGGGGTDGGLPTHIGTGGAGGTGGGGTGGKASSIQATAGTVNTGGGGGGASSNVSPYSLGAAGGSGIVILRYSTSLTCTIGAGLTGTTSTVGSNKVTTLTAGTGNVSFA